MHDLIAKAQTFALAAHAAVGQLRKYTTDPYIVHPMEVMAIIKQVPHDENMLAAALLHDVLEDTAVEADLLEQEFGRDIAMLVAQISDISKPDDGNRRVRKEIDRQHIAKASARAKTIKLADLISNTRSIVDHDPHFARVYLKEKDALLEVLGDGNLQLFDQARDVLACSLAALDGIDMLTAADDRKPA